MIPVEAMYNYSSYAKKKKFSYIAINQWNDVCLYYKTKKYTLEMNMTTTESSLYVGDVLIKRTFKRPEEFQTARDFLHDLVY